MYKIVANLEAGVVEIMADEREDIDTLPGTSEISMGSNCFVIEDGSVWVLNSEDHWIEIE